MLETICAFSNEPRLDGGYLLLGVAEANQPDLNGRFVVVGVENPEKLQADLVSQCACCLQSSDSS
ncbi:MAG: helix-turn-helix domain-containing protein [Cyanobium sp.]